jgi:hypothetical protein
MPKAVPTHWSLKPDKNHKGTYYRRLDDIAKGLRKIDQLEMPPAGKFLFLYYGCEKLAKGIVGIHFQWEAEAASWRILDPRQLRTAAAAMNLAITDAELNLLFSDDANSARQLRNKIVHDFGPWNFGNIVENSATLNPRMHAFLDKHTPPVLAHLTANYWHLLADPGKKP